MSRIFVTHVEIANQFAATSNRFGFDQDAVDSWEDDILDLQELWEKHGYIDVFDPACHNYVAYGMIKSSTSDPGASPAYDNFYHGRILKRENDPLIIISFKGEVVPRQRYEKAVILAMIDHDTMFMPPGRKYPHLKAQQRSWVRSVIDTDRRA